MAPPANSGRRELEWQVLCLFCARFAAKIALGNIDAEILRSEDFEDPVHRALFAEIVRCAERKMPAEELRRWLPAEMTRWGWPELDFDELFHGAPPDSAREVFLESVRSLREFAERKNDRHT